MQNKLNKTIKNNNNKIINHIKGNRIGSVY